MTAWGFGLLHTCIQGWSSSSSLCSVFSMLSLPSFSEASNDRSCQMLL